MPYLICKNCDIYYEIHSKDEAAETDTCHCGNKLKYYDSLEEYLPRKGNIKNPSNNVDLFPKLLNSHESSISKIILCCVNELPFPLGISKTIRVLKGSKSSFIIDYKLNKLDTYSVFSNFTRKRLERYIRTLIHLGFLKINYVSRFHNMPTLSLTDEGLSFLKGDENLKISIYGKNAVDYMQDVDKNLYNALRNLRKEIAREMDTPAYIVCSNEPLLEMARQKPTDFDSMIKIKGIGKRFIENYGERFLSLLKEHNSQRHALNQSKNAKIEAENGQTRREESSKNLYILLRDSDGRKRAHGAYLMGETRDPRYLSFLCQATEDEDGNVRRMAVSALGKISDERAIKALVALLSDSKPQVRQYAVKAMGEIESIKAIPYLEKSEYDEVPYVRKAAQTAISKIKN